jgi:hypothetical protein
MCQAVFIFTHTSRRNTMFKKNIGSLDRTLRIIIGVVLIGLTLTGNIGAWGWIGVLPLLTGLMSSCALYSLLGINTCKR